MNARKVQACVMLAVGVLCLSTGALATDATFVECQDVYTAQCPAATLTTQCTSAGLLREYVANGAWGSGWINGYFYQNGAAWPQDWLETAMNPTSWLDSTYADGSYGSSPNALAVFTGHGLTGFLGYGMAFGTPHDGVCDALIWPPNQCYVHLGEGAGDPHGGDGHVKFIVQDSCISMDAGEIPYVWLPSQTGGGYGCGMMGRAHQGFGFDDEANASSTRLGAFALYIGFGYTNQQAWLLAGDDGNCANQPRVLTKAWNAPAVTYKAETMTMMNFHQYTDPPYYDGWSYTVSCF